MTAVRKRARWLVPSMIASVVVVAILAYWDGERESAAALRDFGQEQATLAESVARELGPHLAAPATSLSRIDVSDRAIEQSGFRILLLEPPGKRHLVDVDGRPVESPPLEDALARGEKTARLSRPEAVAVGLPSRTAIAGLASIEPAPGQRWGVAVVTSALRERDRERRARARLVLAVTIAAGLVLVFGGFALRNQRLELELAHQLALTKLARERDERLERVSQAATMLTLASGMAHELSTPLGVIVGRAEQLAARAAGDERATRSVQAIIEQAERIREVVRGFLSLARGGTPTLKEVAPGAIVQGALALVEHRFSQAGVSLQADVPSGLPAIRGEPRLLEHALVNLLLNACDACARGGHVGVSAGRVGGAVEIAVVDDGAGIASRDAARVAEPFFTTKATGTGLGLAVTNEIVKTHRGALHIGPAEPRGTRAAFQIPIAPGASDAAA